MSFLSVIKSIGHVLGVASTVETQFAPVIGAIPVAGPVINTIFGAIVAAENLITVASQGAAKKAVVTAVVNAQAPGLDPSHLSTVIDQVVAAMNALAAAVASIPATPPAPTK